MKRGNLPDGGHDKLTWKCSRGLLTRRSDNVTLRRRRDVLMGGRRYVPLLVVWFETCFRRRRDVPMVLLRYRHDFLYFVLETYHWDVLATFRRDVITTSPRRRFTRCESNLANKLRSIDKGIRSIEKKLLLIVHELIPFLGSPRGTKHNMNF